MIFMFRDYDTVILRNTNYIFRTNFSGSPERDNFGNSYRNVTLVIPDPALAQELIDAGCNVGMTKFDPSYDNEETFRPEYYIQVNIKMEKATPPAIKWVAPNGQITVCDIDTIKELDSIRIRRIDCNACLVPKTGPRAKYRYGLYANSMYVYQKADEDPLDAYYHEEFPDEAEGDLPF